MGYCIDSTDSTDSIGRYIGYISRNNNGFRSSFRNSSRSSLTGSYCTNCMGFRTDSRIDDMESCSCCSLGNCSSGSNFHSSNTSDKVSIVHTPGCYLQQRLLRQERQLTPVLSYFAYSKFRISPLRHYIL